MNKFVINLDSLSREELILLIQNLKKELAEEKEGHNVSSKCWEYLCQVKDRKIEELIDVLTDLKEYYNDKLEYIKEILDV